MPCDSTGPIIQDIWDVYSLVQATTPVTRSFLHRHFLCSWQQNGAMEGLKRSFKVSKIFPVKRKGEVTPNILTTPVDSASHDWL